MNYSQALKHKQDILKFLEDSPTPYSFEIVIAPFQSEDFNCFLEEYKSNSENFNDESCIDYCTDGRYIVYKIYKDELKDNI